MLAVPQAATVLHGAASVSSAAKAPHAVAPPIAAATPAAETPPIAQAAALAGALALLKAPVVTGVAMQASAELVWAHGATTEIAHAAQTGLAVAVLPAQTLVPNVRTPEIAKAPPTATHASGGPTNRAPHVARATKALHLAALVPAAKIAFGDPASTKAMMQLDHDADLAAKVMRGVARALAVKNAVRDLVSARVVSDPAPAQAAAKDARDLDSLKAMTPAHRDLVPGVKAPAPTAHVVKAMRGGVRV